MATGNVCAQQERGAEGKGGGWLCHPLVQLGGSVLLAVQLGVACALSVISLLLIQKFFALLKSDHNDNYTSITGRGEEGGGDGG